MMRYEIIGGFVVFPDGTRVRAISGSQEGFSAIEFQADAGQLVNDMNVDFVLNVGQDLPGGLPVSTMDGGVPFGGSYAAGYTGLADYIRSGGDPESYIASLNATSTADILRGGGESPGFDPTVFNPNAPTQGADWNITSLIDSFTKGITAVGAATAGIISATGRSGGTSASKGNPQQAVTPSLAQRMFGGLTPGAQGQPPNLVMYGAIAAVLAILLFMLGRQRVA